jgi:translation initiation factor 5B
MVGGHVDHGKTTLLDRIRKTTVANKEAGKITQHVAITKIPISTIKSICGNLLEKYKFNLDIPNIIFIDTPGHEAFMTLRERASELADIVILVVDLMQTCQPQTIEVINYLKKNKTPFLIALTKVDKLKGYNVNLEMKDLLNEIDENSTLYAQEFNKKFYVIMGQLSEHGFVTERFDRVRDFTKELVMVPVNSKTGLGIPETLLFLAGLSQRYLDKALTIDIDQLGKGTVLEIKEEKGFGRTMDVILLNGKISKKDYIKIDSNRGTAVGKVKFLLKASHDGYIKTDSEQAAAGVRIVASNIDSANAGDIFYVISEKEAKEYENLVKEINKKGEKGVVVKVDSEGTGDAFKQLAEKNEVDIYKTSIGTITKEDIMEAKVFKEKDFKYGAILVFNQKFTPEIESFAKSQGIEIFSNNIIYKIFEDYVKWVEEETIRHKEEDFKIITLPAKFKILETCVFRKCKPLICGIKVEQGILRPNTKIVFDSKIAGTIKNIEDNGKALKEATEGMEVAVSIEGLNAEKINDFDQSFYTYMNNKDIEISNKYIEDKELLKEIEEEMMKLH